MTNCKGKTVLGKNCNRRVKNGLYCYQHKIYPYLQDKPPDCIVCYENINKETNPLECGHWIHKKCVIKSAKAECPICRAKLHFGNNTMNKINKLYRKRQEEYLVEEEELLRNDLHNQLTELINPSIQQRINNVIEQFFEDTDIENDVIEDEIYQNLLYSFMNY